MPRSSKFTATLTAFLFSSGAIYARSLSAADPPQSPQVATTAEEPLEEVIIIGSLIPAIPYNVFNYNVYGRSVYVGAQYKIRK
jgi:hypothetical protein